MIKEGCSSCGRKLEEKDRWHYYSLSVKGPKSKYYYCETCQNKRIKDIEDFMKTQWAKDFPEFIESIEYYSCKGSRDTLKEALEYDVNLKTGKDKFLKNKNKSISSLNI